jgi:hypothetical protein
VSLPSDRLLYQDAQGLAAGQLLGWTEHHYTRVVSGHKQVRSVQVAATDGLTSWDSYLEAATGYGHPEATLWVCLIRELSPQPQAVTEAYALVSTRSWADGFVALQAFRARWHIENDQYRELKQGWRLEEQRWGRDLLVISGRTTLTCLAFNTAQVYRSQAGERLVHMAIRRLRRERRPEWGAAPVVIYIAGCYAVLALEELVAALGAPVRESLLPALGHSSEPTPPP